MLQQDLHIHTIYSENDNAVMAEQTIALVAAIGHANIVGISDHFENLVDGAFAAYEKQIRHAGLKLGTEVDGHQWVGQASTYDMDYYIVHCRDIDADYRGLERLLATAKPVIVAHPNALGTDLNRVPAECLVELNNRYIWRCDWRHFYGPYKNRFRWVFSSDAHQPHWLGQAVARHVAAQLGIEEHILF